MKLILKSESNKSKVESKLAKRKRESSRILDLWRNLFAQVSCLVPTLEKLKEKELWLDIPFLLNIKI